MKLSVFAAVVMFVAVIALVQAQSDTPTADYLSAALVDQLSKSGGSIVADYTYDPGAGAEDRTIMSFHYVRTPNALRLEELGPGPVQRMVSTMDRQSNEYRQLQVETADRSWGSVNNKLVGGLFGIQITIDPIYRFVDGSPLFETIRRGKVSPDQESIDGHPCWRVEILPKDETERVYKGYVVWLDPSVGFNPRKVKWNQKDDLPRPNVLNTEVKFLDYQDVGDGLWFPQRAEFVTTWDNGNTQTGEARITGLEAGKNIPPEDVVVKFPTGTKVKDVTRQIEYTVP
ncbi:MAG: hypothetical protein Q7T82_09645 [Armatimonadota bacterium]|nr:hypothetical protein [Armatimonadota bacterium]